MIVLTYASDLLIAILFFLSFYMKVTNLHQLPLEINSYQVIPYYYAKIAAYLLLITEGGIFLLYITGLAFVMKELLLIVLLLVFIALILRKRKQQGNLECGCFGKADSLNKYPLQRNMILLVIVIAKLFLPIRMFSLEESITFIFFITGMVMIYDILTDVVRLREINKGV